MQLQNSTTWLPGVDVRIVALYRGESHVPLQGELTFVAGGEAHMILTPSHLEAVT